MTLVAFFLRRNEEVLKEGIEYTSKLSLFMEKEHETFRIDNGCRTCPKRIGSQICKLEI